ncbi:MAG: DNA primase [Erysipelotrichaceae bacterium]|nr:DNA primase [Erysipelotrichaceae bacterium]
MKLRISQQDIDNIRQQADIVDIIGRYIPIEKKGSNAYRAVCPFHDDHDPSLSISPSRQIFKCFVCQKGGNVFGFVQEYDKVSYVEAIAKVAQMINYPLDLSQVVPVKKVNSKYSAYYELLNEMIKFCRYSLNTPSGLKAKEYLFARKLDDDIIDMFDIGYNGDRNSVYNFLTAKKYDKQAMIDTNIIFDNEYGCNDVFAKRIIFPIHDEYGNPIGFTARSLDENASKYINTSTTPIYVKGSFVYNLHRAKSYAKKANKIIVVEGVMDVIAFAKAGIYNVVASLGTALTLKQLHLIKQCSMNVVFAYDGDNAGQNAIYKAGLMAVDEGFNVSVYRNLTTLDPDELVQNKGASYLQQTIDQAYAWMEFLFAYLQKKYNLDVYSESKAFANELIAQISKLKDEYDRLNFKHQLENITGFSVGNLVETKQEVKVSEIKSARVGDGLYDAQMQILNALLQSFDAIEIFLQDLGYLPDENCQLLAMMIIDEYRQNKRVDASKLFDDIVDDNLRSLLIKMINSEVDQAYDEDRLKGAIKKIKINMLENKTKQLKKQLRSLHELSAKQELMKQLDSNFKELRKLYDEENG